MQKRDSTAENECTNTFTTQSKNIETDHWKQTSVVKNKSRVIFHLSEANQIFQHLLLDYGVDLEAANCEV